MSGQRLSSGVLMVAVLAAAVLTGCSTDATMNDPPVADESVPDIVPRAAIGQPELASPGDYREFYRGTLTVDNQVTDGTSVRIQRAGIDDMVAWVAVRHADRPDARELLGATRLPPAATKDDVTVQLEPALPPGRYLLEAVLYQDARPVGQFDPQVGDNPITNREGDVVVRQFRLTVPPEGSG